jgi:hypothetical protein
MHQGKKGRAYSIKRAFVFFASRKKEIKRKIEKDERKEGEK